MQGCVGPVPYMQFVVDKYDPDIMDGHYLTHAHSHYHEGSGSHGQLFRPYWGSSAWHSRLFSDWGKPVYQKPFPAEASPLSASSTQHMWELLAGNHTVPTTCAGKADHGLGVCEPLALICLLKIVN